MEESYKQLLTKHDYLAVKVNRVDMELQEVRKALKELNK